MSNALNDTVIINEDGKRRKITFQEAIIKRVVTKAVAGDFRATQMVLNQIPMIEARRAETFNPTPLPPGIVNLFEGAVRIIEEHGATPPNMQRAIPMADATMPVKAAPTILSASAADANSAQAKKPEEEDPSF
jgi:hypothetical protein